jgi:hypothetical protein
MSWISHWEQGDSAFLSTGKWCVLFTVYMCLHFDVPRYLATNAAAWLHTKGIPGVLRIPEPVETFSWAITATKGATSWIHIDANGTATSIYESCGRKYWVLGKKKRGNTELRVPGDMRSPAAFGKDWDCTGDGTAVFEWEGVLLEPGQLL